MRLLGNFLHNRDKAKTLKKTEGLLWWEEGRSYAVEVVNALLQANADLEDSCRSVAIS